MTKDILLARIKELTATIQTSLENHHRIKTELEHATNSHNALVGRLDEATRLYNEFEKTEVQAITENVIVE